MTEAEICDALERIGVRPGMGLVVHSSLRSLGWVDDGPAVVCRALMRALTPDGTLLMPTFNHGKPFEQGEAGFYDPETTPSVNGAITEAFRQLPGVHRSLNPTHPWSAWGKHAKRYLERHHATRTMGHDSPLGHLHADDGFCLLLGVGYRANTFHHVVETSVDAPCLGIRTVVHPVRIGDKFREGHTWGFRNGDCPFNDAVDDDGEPAYASRMQAVEHTLPVGRGAWRFYRLQEGYPVIADWLLNGNDQFPGCTDCSIRPQA